MPDRYREGPQSSRSRQGRSFGEEGRFSSDQARYYGADRRDYGPYANRDPHASRLDARADYGPDEAHGYRSFEGDYHREQEYGVPAGGGRIARRDPNRGDDLGYESRRRRGPYADGPYGDQPLPHDRGSREFGPPADYAYHPNLDRDLEPDYLAWRDEQLRSHDRDYGDWRAEQHQRYDSEYRAFRSERKSTFGKSFADWQAERRASGEIAQPSADKTPDDKV